MSMDGPQASLCASASLLAHHHHYMVFGPSFVGLFSYCLWCLPYYIQHLGQTHRCPRVGHLGPFPSATMGAVHTLVQTLQWAALRRHPCLDLYRAHLFQGGYPRLDLCYSVTTQAVDTLAPPPCEPLVLPRASLLVVCTSGMSAMEGGWVWRKKWVANIRMWHFG